MPWAAPAEVSTMTVTNRWGNSVMLAMPYLKGKRACISNALKRVSLTLIFSIIIRASDSCF